MRFSINRPRVLALRCGRQLPGSFLMRITDGVERRVSNPVGIAKQAFGAECVLLCCGRCAACRNACQGRSHVFAGRSPKAMRQSCQQFAGRRLKVPAGVFRPPAQPGPPVPNNTA